MKLNPIMILALLVIAILFYFILENGTECDKQISVCEEFGFNSLRKYLMNSVEYQ